CLAAELRGDHPLKARGITMNKSIWVLFMLPVIFTASQIAFGQSPSSTQATDDKIIACKFGYLQIVKFNVITKSKKEALDLKHTDILIYENDKQQQLVLFKVTEESELKNIGYHYIIGYYSEDSTEDGKYRKIKIVAKHESGKLLKVQPSLDGYYAT